MQTSVSQVKWYFGLSVVLLGLGSALSAEPDRTVLPLALPAFTGKMAPALKDSIPGPTTPVTAPKGAPNVVVVLLDDAGYAQSGTFGALIPTPTLDRLAADGLRYTRFHVTAMCSPTRAALLTGRNHHSVGMGVISNWSSDFPGYTGSIPKSAAFISEVLRANGYATAAIGKWHLIPNAETTQAGPFDHWPTHQGFDYFYGFIGGETDQWHPEITEGTRPETMAVPAGREHDYTLNENLADKAIAWIKSQKSSAPDRPFFIYYAPGATHAPLQAPKAWIEKFKGQFDMGWDKYRELVFARQKNLGVVPPDTVLTPRPAEIPAWDSLTPDQQRLDARLMEIFAGFMAQSDHEIGRVIDTLEQVGARENTLVIYIAGDNGASL
ncbi:MAG: sulfatase-like hydrolase/transferase, partial [Pseudolabrys sp.]|nr:sulfatase-like hydrolase/transferase [Pseudolabrys sp.]